jgi:hypothetical protein
VFGDPRLRPARWKLAVLAWGYQLPLLRSYPIVVTNQSVVPCQRLDSQYNPSLRSSPSRTLSKPWPTDNPTSMMEML